jgi:hypothetical protein
MSYGSNKAAPFLRPSHPDPRSIALSVFCVAQSASVHSSVSGRVLDPARVPVVGARVMAMPEGKGKSTGPSVLTEESEFFFLPLEAGKYTLQVSKGGFADACQFYKLRVPLHNNATFFFGQSHANSTQLNALASATPKRERSERARARTDQHQMPHGVSVCSYSSAIRRQRQQSEVCTCTHRIHTNPSVV